MGNRAIHTEHTVSGQVTDDPAILNGFLIGSDGANDPVIGIYDGTSDSDEIAIPPTTFDASALGLNGAVFSFWINCPNGIYIDIANLGTGKIVVYHMHQFNI